VKRRTLLQALPALVFGASLARAEGAIPIADMHSHFGMLRRKSLPSAAFAGDLRAQRVALVAWALPSDLRWTRAVPTGIAQAGEPAPGELPAFFRDRLAKMKAYVTASGLRLVLAKADVDACIRGESGVVLAAEGADFLEGRVADLGRFYDLGLRHVQLVHYIRNPIGDFQTIAPVHNGLSAAGRRLVEACNEKGILVDLAHCSPAAVEQALAISTKPVVWSHSWVDTTEGRWQDGFGYLQRRLSLEQAKKIAAKGGVVGLWGLGLSKPGPSRTPGQGNWTVARGDPRGYARELANLVRWLGADHVGLGTDLEGVGDGWSVDDYDHVRSVIDFLRDMKLPADAVEKVACGNYARVLKTALRN